MAKNRTKVADLRAAFEKRIAAIPPADNEAADLREWILRVAIIAAIPPDSVDAFLKEVWDHIVQSEFEAQSDRVRRRCKAQINKLVTATRKMIDAIEDVQKHQEEDAWSALDDYFIGEYLERWSSEVRSLAKNPHPLDDLKRRLSNLQQQAKFFSSAKLPKRNEHRTTSRINILLQNIRLTARKFGGDLRYTKHADPGKRGSLEEVMEYLDLAQKGNPPTFRMPGWENPSPSTLERLRSPRPRR